MPYPPMIEYNDAVQHEEQAFFDAELKRGEVKKSNLGLPVVMSGGFALTYEVSTQKKKFAVRCFHREIPSIEQKYELISKKLRSLHSKYFVEFNYEKQGIKVLQSTYPIVKMDWVEGDPLGVWLDKTYSHSAALQNARMQFQEISLFLEKEGMAHGDIQNGNVMMAPSGVTLIDYDGMFVPGMVQGNGSETGHKHFQHRRRSSSDFGPKMDRFSFIALDLSLLAVIEEKALYPKYRAGGETIIFTANDFADPQNSDVFNILLNKPKLKDAARNFAAICDADINAVPTLEDFLKGKNIPAAKPRVYTAAPTLQRPTIYIPAFPVVDALDFASAERRVGDKIELIGKIVEVKIDTGRRGKGKNKPYVFINFGPWRGSIVKISIWSEGLSKIKEQPSSAWVGRWVSVTGLLDPPYKSRRYGYTHLSVTVQEDGQIQTLEETQARFRLASIGKNTGSVSSATTGSTASPKTSNNGAKSAPAKTGTSNAAILNKYKGTSPQPTHTRTQAQPTTTPKYSGVTAHSPAPKTLLGSVPKWVWIVGGLFILFKLLGVFDTAKQRTEIPNNSNRQTTPHPYSPQSQTTAPQNRTQLSPRAGQTSSPQNKNDNQIAIQNFPIDPRKDLSSNNVQIPAATSPKEAPPLPPPIQIGPNNSSGSQLTDAAPTTPPTTQPGPGPNALPFPSNADTGLTGLPKSPPLALEPSINGSGDLLDLTRAADVQSIQRRLSELGTFPGGVNGLWSLQTQQALADFQMANGLEPDRKFSKTTQEILFASTANRVSSTSISTYAGGWAPDQSQCQNAELGRAPILITPTRAEAFGTVCNFTFVQRESSAWRIRARCVDEEKTWFPNIRLLRTRNQLIWSSELGTTIYVQCTAARPR